MLVLAAERAGPVVEANPHATANPGIKLAPGDVATSLRCYENTSKSDAVMQSSGVPSQFTISVSPSQRSGSPGTDLAQLAQLPETAASTSNSHICASCRNCIGNPLRKRRAYSDRNRSSLSWLKHSSLSNSADGHRNVSKSSARALAS